MGRIRKWFRRKYILFRYKHNYKSGKLIYLKSSDRQFGLTTELIKESLAKDIPILVHNSNAKKYMAHEMYKMGQLLLVPCVTEQYAMDNLLITPTDNLRGRGINWILVDNGCTESDVVKLLDNNYPIAIMNGYITKLFNGLIEETFYFVYRRRKDMYKWKVDFHMKNGEVIETKVESKYSGSTDLLRMSDSNLGLANISDNTFNTYLSSDGKTQIVIKVGEVSSVHISEFLN